MCVHVPAVNAEQIKKETVPKNLSAVTEYINIQPFRNLFIACTQIPVDTLCLL